MSVFSIAVVGFFTLLSLQSSNAVAQAPKVSESSLRAHLAFLADDLLEGRGTGQRGGELAVRYLETQAALIGLKPLQGTSFRQAVNIVGSQTLATSSVSFTLAGKVITPALGSEIVFGTSSGQTEVGLDAPLVFVGYGIRAPGRKLGRFQGARSERETAAHDGQ